jgi:hypothetical protein
LADALELLPLLEHPGVAGPGQVIAGGGDQHLQRLLARAGAGEHRVDLGVVVVLVVLVVDRAARALPVARIARDRLELAVVVERTSAWR